MLERKKIAQDAGKASSWLNIRIVTVVESADSQNSIGQQRNPDPNESRPSLFHVAPNAKLSLLKLSTKFAAFLMCENLFIRY